MPGTLRRLRRPRTGRGRGHASAHAPGANAFRYPAFCLRLPLSRLDAAAPALRHRAATRAACCRSTTATTARATARRCCRWIRALLAREGIDADGEVVLHTFPRMLGYLFNPVSFWVCHDAPARVAAVLARGATTPSASATCYLVAHPDGRADRRRRRRSRRARSSTCRRSATSAGATRSASTSAAGRWLARIDYFDDDGDAPLIATSIAGDRRAARPAGAPARSSRYPAFTLGVVARIHWQAAKLWAKRVPFFAKPAPPAVARSPADR